MIDLHTVQKCLVVLALFMHEFGMDKLGHEILGKGFTDGVLICRDEWCCLGCGGFPVYRGTVGPEPDCEVLRVDLTGMVVL